MNTPLRDLIRQNRLVEAIKQTATNPKSRKDKNALSLLESRLNDLNEKNRLGLLSEENANLELNKIRKSLLEIVDRMEAAPGNTPGQNPLLSKKVILLSLAVIIPILFFAFRLSGGEEMQASAAKVCKDVKVAILVADFQNTENENQPEGFSNSLVTRMDNELEDSKYDVSPVGHQSRKVKRYDDFIRKTHFDNSCDTSGLFVNGYLNREEEVFNAYITIANMKMDIPGLGAANSLDLDNPSGIEFSITDDAQFFADFILGIIKCYEGEPYAALQMFFELERNDENEITRKDDNFKATLAHFKGNAYAMRGDNARAKSQYAVAKKYGNSEIREAADQNMTTADEINQEMKADPELKKDLARNLSEHATWEKELQKIINKVGRDVVNVIKGFR